MDKGKVIFKRSAFYGDAKITNKAVSGVLEKDEKKVVNTASKRRELYDKFKDFGSRGQGLTDKEAKMALAELKYGNDNHFSKKGINTLAQELGLGKGAISKNTLRSATKYKQRASHASPNKIVADIRKTADKKVNQRRENYADTLSKKQKSSLLNKRTSSAVKSQRSNNRLSNIRNNETRSSLSVARNSMHTSRSINPSSTTSRIQGRSSAGRYPKGVPVSPLARLSGGLGGRFGGSHSNYSRLR